MFDLASYLSEKRELVDESLCGFLDEAGPQGPLLAAMRYSLMAGGKRLRPVLCLAAAEAVGGDPSSCMPAACALEMIHTYSLIHDDLPAMDDDALRRGKPTCHVAFDEATAILAGDALLTHAFQLLSWEQAICQGQAENWLAVIRTIAKAAGPSGMIEGQMLDIGAEGKTLSLEELESLHSLKTGALIIAPVTSGAILSGATQTQLHSLKTYAARIGLAFQVADDILNVEGDPILMGKATGTDAERSKATYPALLGLDRSKRFAADLVREALAALDPFDAAADPLRAIARYIIDRKR